jgi:hypothetical protein
MGMTGMRLIAASEQAKGKYLATILVTKTFLPTRPGILEVT